MSQCEKRLTDDVLISYIHAHEKGSYLKACGWTQQEYREKVYDCYVVGGKIYSKRSFWGWAKRTGLVGKFGTTDAKKILAKILKAEVIMEPSKIKFIKRRTKHDCP